MDTLAAARKASARERRVAILLNLHQRLVAAGDVIDDVFDRPSTQEAFGDLTGLTAVHVNGTLRDLETDRLIARAYQIGLMERYFLITRSRFTLGAPA